MWCGEDADSGMKQQQQQQQQQQQPAQPRLRPPPPPAQPLPRRQVAATSTRAIPIIDLTESDEDETESSTPQLEIHGTGARNTASTCGRPTVSAGVIDSNAGHNLKKPSKRPCDGSKLMFSNERKDSTKMVKIETQDCHVCQRDHAPKTSMDDNLKRYKREDEQQKEISPGINVPAAIIKSPHSSVQSPPATGNGTGPKLLVVRRAAEQAATAQPMQHTLQRGSVAIAGLGAAVSRASRPAVALPEGGEQQLRDHLRQQQMQLSNVTSTAARFGQGVGGHLASQERSAATSTPSPTKRLRVTTVALTRFTLGNAQQQIQYVQDDLQNEENHRECAMMAALAVFIGHGFMLNRPTFQPLAPAGGVGNIVIQQPAAGRYVLQNPLPGNLRATTPPGRQARNEEGAAVQANAGSLLTRNGNRPPEASNSQPANQRQPEGGYQEDQQDGRAPGSKGARFPK